MKYATSRFKSQDETSVSSFLRAYLLAAELVPGLGLLPDALGAFPAAEGLVSAGVTEAVLLSVGIVKTK